MTAVLILGCVSAPVALAQGPQPTGVLLENVRVFDGKSERLSPPANVLVVGNTIKTVSTAPVVPPPGTQLTTINGGERVLMPGLIDAHWHSMFATPALAVGLSADFGYLNLVAGREATNTLMRGFTSVRDVGGPIFGLKRAIDEGVVPGPRVWPSGAVISQTGGHGDYRAPYEIPSAANAPLHHSEQIGAAAIADSPDEVRKRARELLMLGASQLKLAAGGGVSSNYDPLDVSQYTEAEIRAAVEAAENWGTRPRLHAARDPDGNQGRRQVYRARATGQRAERQTDGREGNLVEPAAVPRR